MVSSGNTSPFGSSSLTNSVQFFLSLWSRSILLALTDQGEPAPTLIPAVKNNQMHDFKKSSTLSLPYVPSHSRLLTLAFFLFVASIIIPSIAIFIHLFKYMREKKTLRKMSLFGFEICCHQKKMLTFDMTSN
jgi:hypothetical protein